MAVVAKALKLLFSRSQFNASYFVFKKNVYFNSVFCWFSYRTKQANDKESNQQRTRKKNCLKSILSIVLSSLCTHFYRYSLRLLIFYLFFIFRIYFALLFYAKPWYCAHRAQNAKKIYKRQQREKNENKIDYVYIANYGLNATLNGQWEKETNRSNNSSRKKIFFFHSDIY